MRPRASPTQHNMSDTDSKRAMKGAEHVPAKKRAAAAALAAAEAFTGIEDADNTDDRAPAMSPRNRKSKKQDRKQLKQTPVVAAKMIESKEEDVEDEAEEEDEEAEEEAEEEEKVTEVKEEKVVVLLPPTPPPVMEAAAAEVHVKVEDIAVNSAETTDKESRMCSDGKVLSICPSVRKLVSNVAKASSGPANVLSVTSRPETHVLVMITNDVEWVTKMNKERESAFTNLNFVVLKVLEPGFNSAPYEKAEGANAKQLVYCDKKGKCLNGKPTKLATVTVVDNVKHLDLKTWEMHPSAMMKTKWRGLPTECVGVISPGLPFSCSIFNENKDSVMENDNTENNLKPFSLAIIGLVVKSREQCAAGYGVGVKSIKHIEGANATMTGLYHDRCFYTDSRPISEQTDERLAIKTRCKEYSTDLLFVNKLIRYSSQKYSTNEKPVVLILPSALGDKWSNRHHVHMQPNNELLVLEMTDPESMYHGMRFRVCIPENMFTIEETGLMWIQFYFQWLLDANVCRIMVVHNEYQYNRMTDGTGSASMHCILVPAEELLLSDKCKPLHLSAAVMSSLQERITGRKNSLEMYTGWVVRHDLVANKTYGVLFDSTKAYAPEVDKKSAEEDNVSTVVSAGKQTEECDPAHEHTSIVCRIYKGMHPARHIWRAYLLIIDTEQDTVERMFQIGLKSRPAYAKAAAAGGVAADSNIFESCDMDFV